MTTTSKLVIFCFMSSMLLSCTTMRTNISRPLVLPANAAIVVGPIANNSDTPLANRQVETMTIGLLQAKCFKNVSAYPRRQSCDKLLYCPEDSVNTNQLMHWAKQHHASYVLTGAANEWRYKVGLDGEPVAGVSLNLIDVRSGKTVWTGVGSAIGGSRSGLDVIGQEMLTKLLSALGAVC